jgi:hypothetical protein
MDEGAGASFGMVWDPFEQDNWNRENYTAESVVRTKKDLAEIIKEKPHGIYAAPDSDDITKVYILESKLLQCIRTCSHPSNSILHRFMDLF